MEGVLTVAGLQCGSGGSLFVECNDVKGSGLISAKGGDAVWADCGGGGGGRVAIYTTVFPMTYAEATVNINGGKSPLYVTAGSAGSYLSRRARTRIGTLVGTPCNYAFPPEIEAIGESIVGGKILVSARGSNSKSNFLVLGASSQSWGPYTLPLDVSALGFPAGCYLNVSLDVLWQIGSPLAGYQHASIEIPNNSVLKNTTVYFQWLLLDDPRGIAFTRGLAIAIR